MGIRLTILWIWQLFDPIFFICSRLHYIHSVSSNNSIFRVRITRYKGKTLILSDGTKIRKNDLLLKIHLHNIRLLMQFINMKNDLSRSRKIYKTVLYSMQPLARYLKNHPLEKNIKGVIGITTINKGVGQLGFECFSPSNPFYKWFKKMGQLPITLLSCTPVKSFQKHHLTYLIMSKENLYSRHLKEITSPNLELFTKHNQARIAKN
jgi:hypothetical protein